MSDFYTAESKAYPLIDHATGETIGYSRYNTKEEVAEIIKKARIAQKNWAAKGYNERKKHILRIRDYIIENSDHISLVISKVTGKTHIDALSTEVIPAAMASTYYAKNTGKLLEPKKLKAGNILFLNKRSKIIRVPFGVIGIISPWNYPFAIPFHEIIMALMSGNAVILKAASQVEQIGRLIKQTIEAGDLPKNLFNLINMPGKAAGEALIEAGVNKIFFTGSTDVGKNLMALCSKKLIPVSLELGGNDAMIVCRDANLHRAANGALWAGFSNCGQSCAAVERIYVEEEVYDEFTRLLREKTNTLRHGTDYEHDVDLGSLTNEDQLNIVRSHLEDAINRGAEITACSKPVRAESGLFHQAVVVENVDDSMTLMKEETFGPVLAVSKVKNIEEAIKKANDSKFGLTASIWTKNKKKAQIIASQLEAGTVTINDHLMSHGLAETPWGGFKESGIGRTHGQSGLEEMTQPLTIVDDILPFVQKNMWWYPHNKEVFDGLNGVLSFLYEKKLRLRISGGLKLVKLFMRTFRK